MPGPSNKSKGKSRGKKYKKRNFCFSEVSVQPSSVFVPAAPVDVKEAPEIISAIRSSTNSPSSSPSLKTPSPYYFDFASMGKEIKALDEGITKVVERALFEEPFIHDPGNGPRVRNIHSFMASSFAQPPALDDPLCAEFSQGEVLQMLCTVLPEDTAMILWYNKSRSHSRICPSCQRLYRIGDTLPDLTVEGPVESKYTSPVLLQEQKISGLCSPVCFIMASFNYPNAIKSAWGRMADVMDDMTWDLLNRPVDAAFESEISRTLALIIRMTRLHDLGLAQLCFGAEDATKLLLLEESQHEFEVAPASVSA